MGHIFPKLASEIGNHATNRDLKGTSASNWTTAIGKALES